MAARRSSGGELSGGAGGNWEDAASQSSSWPSRRRGAPPPRPPALFSRAHGPVCGSGQAAYRARLKYHALLHDCQELLKARLSELREQVTVFALEITGHI